MKTLLTLLFTLSALFSSELTLKNITLTTENDADFRTDRDYTYGSELSALFEKAKNSYLSFSVAHQMFTPKDFDEENIDFSKERPYAGYIYLGLGFHDVSNNLLSSLNFQLGFVGPSTKMDQVQKIIHDLIGSPEPKGWDEQIGDELIVQVNYEKRWFNQLQDYDADMIYYLGGNLGNASIKAAGGAMLRLGYNREKDFGPRRIDYRGYNNIPLNGYNTHKTKQSFTVNLWLEGSLVGRDIFLDGNSFKESIHVDKEIFVAKGGFGLHYRYKEFNFDYFRTFSSKEFTTQSYYHSYGSFIFAYNF